MRDQARQNMKDDLDTVDDELRIALSLDLGRNHVSTEMSLHVLAYNMKRAWVSHH